MKVYVVICDTVEPCEAYGDVDVIVDVIGVFATKEAAGKCIEDKSSFLKKERFYEDFGDSISASVSKGIDVRYRYLEYDLQEDYP